MQIFGAKSKEYPAAIVKVKEGQAPKKIKATKIAQIIPDAYEDGLKRTALHYASMQGDAKWLKLMSSQRSDEELLQKDTYGWAPIHYAAEKGHLACLLEDRKNLNRFLPVTNEDGNTPLHLSAMAKKFDQKIVGGMSSQELDQISQIANKNDETILDLYWHGFGIKVLEQLLKRLPVGSALLRKYAFAFRDSKIDS
jgi:hypothetical protein